MYKRLFLLLLLVGLTNIVKAQDKYVQETTFDHDANMETFAFGADISWLSQQESWGTYYCNRQGKRADLMDILKDDFGINALRFRVWVNPAGGWSGKKDVIGLCKRAHAKGFKVMISFHYSDTWADSGSQTIPGQWTDHSVEALEKNVYAHTLDVLSGLKAEGIIPVWVSLGNETKQGMLYETGRTNSTEGVKNFVRFINAGAKAVKEIDPNIITIIHLPNGHDQGTAQKMFDNLEKYGANYDCLGFSAYPRWSHLDITNDTQIASTVKTYLDVFKYLKARFKKPIMVMETGHYGTEPYDANRFFAEFIKQLIDDKELGIFYWEPEAFDNGGYNLGAWSSTTHQGTIAMDGFKGTKFTKVDKYATTRLSLLDDKRIYQPADTMEVKVYAKTSTTVTSLSKVDFYLNTKKVHSMVPEKASTIYFTYQTDTLPAGDYTFHALVYDNQGNRESTDTLGFMVGNVSVFQENEPGFAGISDNTVTIAKTTKRYTGEGYITASDNRNTSVNWDINFPQAGTYTLYVRYHTDDRRTMAFTLNDSIKFSVTGKATPQGRWAYTSKDFDIETPGHYHIAMQSSLSKGFPEIDFIAFASPEGGSPVTAFDPTSVAVTTASGKTSTLYYDLQGRPIPANRTKHKGIYLHNGRKIVVNGE